jgi:hypothetical protein
MLPVAVPDPLLPLPDERDEGGGALADAPAPGLALCRRSSALRRSLALARSSRKRDSSLLASPPDSVPAPEIALLPGLGAEDVVVGGLPGGAPAEAVLDGFPALAPVEALPGWLPEVLETLGVSAPLGALALGAGVVAGGLPGVDEGGALSALDADGTLGSPGLALGGVAAVVEVLLSEGAVDTGLAGVSTFVSLLHAAIDVPIATALAAMRNLRVNIVCSGSYR